MPHEKTRPQRKQILIIIFSLFLILSTILKLAVTSHPLENIETNRDYLIARHIIRYGEFPLVGPINGIYEALRNSPFYYYVLSGFLFFSDNIMTLQYTNVLLQSIALLLLFGIGSTLFNPLTGVVAAVLYGISFEHWENASSIWQPHLMLPVFLFGVFLCARAWKQQKPQLWYLAAIVLACATALHLSVISFLPLFLILVTLVTPSPGRVGVPLRLGVFLFAVLLVLFAPMMFVAQANGSLNVPALLKILQNSPTAYIVSFFRSIRIILSRLVLNDVMIPQYISWIPVILSFFIIKTSIFVQPPNLKRTSALLFLAALQPPLWIALFRIQPKHFWLEPSYPLFVLLLVQTSLFLWEKRHSWSGIIAAILLFSSFLLTSMHVLSDIPARIRTRNKTKILVSVVTTAIADEIRLIRDKNNYSNNRFFNLVYYQDNKPIERYAAVWWTTLEKQLDEPFVRVVNYGEGYESINTENYIFLICFRYEPNKAQSNCRSFFSVNHPQKIIIKTLLESDAVSLYLAKPM